MSRTLVPLAAVLLLSVLVAASRPYSAAEQTISAKLLGQWTPHPNTKDVMWPSRVPLASHPTDPISDQWQLEFAIDGTAKFTGRTHFILDAGVPVDDAKIVAPEFKSKPFMITGQWSIVGDRLSIVSDKPSIHSWEIIAITDRQLVLRSTTASEGKPVDMFWVKRRR